MKKQTIVGALAVVKNSNEQFLMGLRNDQERPDLHHLWEFPGGVVEFDEKPEEAVVREVEEEMGVKVKILRPILPVIISYDLQKPSLKRYLLFPYFCKIIKGEPKPSDPEVEKIRWVRLEEIKADRCMPSTEKVLKNVLKLKKCLT